MATLLGGGVVAPSAFAANTGDASAAQSQAQAQQTQQQAPAQSGTDAQHSTAAGGQASNSPEAAGGTGGTDDAGAKAKADTTIASIEDPEPIRGIAGDAKLALPPAVVVHYSDGTTDKSDVTWAGNGYRTQEDLTRLQAGDYRFIGTVKGSDKHPTATLQLQTSAGQDPNASSPLGKLPHSNNVEPAPRSAEPTPRSAEPTPKSSDGAAKTIASVQPYDMGDYPVGIAPDLQWQEVTVTYNDGSTDWVTPTWDPVDSSKAGDVSVQGTIDGTTLKAQLTIHFVAIASIDKPEYYATSGRAPTGMDSYVNVSLANGSKEDYPIDWNTDAIDWSSTKSGKDITVTGTFHNSTLTTTATVHVRDITSYQPVKVSTITGIEPSLPYQVTANMSGGGTADYDVTWDSIAASQYAKTGSFTVSGTVDGTDKKATATVTVHDFKAFESVFVTTGVGSAPDLPYSVQATLDDGSVQSVSVSWDDVNASQYAKTGTFTVKGVVVDNNGNPTSTKVTATVQVLAIRSVSTYPDTIYVVPGEAPELPTWANEDLSDGSSISSEVTWEHFDPSLYASPNAFTVKGTVPNTTIFAVVTVRVVPIIKVDESNYSALVGTGAVSSPSGVNVTYADGRQDYRSVTWNTVDSAQWNTIGKFDVQGKVDGTDIPAVAHVSVAGLKTTEYSTTTRAGDEPKLYDVDIELTDGTTLYDYGRYGSIDWNTVDPSQYAKPGKFDVQGRIIGTKFTITMHVSVVGIKSVEALSPVSTVTGVMPILPNCATVIYSDGSSSDCDDIDWKAVDPSAYAKSGTFTVDGNISSIGKGISVTVSVYDSQNTKEVSVSTLRGFAPSLPYSMTATLWNGDTMDVEAQWETPDPKSYAKAGSFDVHGYLLGSDIPVVAHIGVYDPTSTVVETVNTVAGVAPALDDENHNSSVTLSNGDVYQVDGIMWNKADPAKYATAGEFDIVGSVLGSDLKFTVHVVVGAFYGWDSQYNPYTTTVVLGSSYEPYLPTTLSALTAAGNDVDLPVTWQPYDKTLLKKAGTITVTGKVTGSSTLTATARIKVVDVKSVNPIQDVVTLTGVAPGLPYYLDATLTDGSAGSLYATWNDVKPDQYAKAGSFTVSGKAGPDYDDPTSAKTPVTVKVNVVSDAAIDPVDVWTVPGVAPQLPYSVSISPTKSLAVGGTGAPDNKTYLPVTWNSVDSKLYAKNKDKSSFTVQGTIEGSSKKVTATVHVASIVSAQLPIVTTVPQMAPNLPWQVNVVTSDGQTHQADASWDDIPGSAYHDAGAIFRVNGRLQVPGNYDDTSTMQVQIKVRVDAPAKLVTSAQQGLTTEAGIRPSLLSTLPVITASGEVVSASVNWDPIPPKNYAKPGSFTVNGHMVALGSNVSTASLKSARSLDARTATDMGTVSATVTVIAKQAKPQVSLVGYGTAVTMPGVKAALPDTATVYLSDGSQDRRSVTWDDSKVNYAKPGNYTITGKVKDTSVQAVYYLTVAATESGTLTGFQPVNKSVEAGTTAKAAAATLPKQVTAIYSDGSSSLTDVDWILTNKQFTDAALSKVGTVIDLEGNVSGTTIKAKAEITVVAADKVPNQPADVNVKTVEGVKPALPGTVTVTYGNGSTSKQSKVTWDQFGGNLWAAGKSGTSFDVKGITEVGGFTITAHVSVAKVATTSISAKASKLTYTKGDTFDASTLKVTANRNDGTSVALAAGDYTVSDTTLNTVGTKKVTVTLKSNTSFTASFTLTVSQRFWTLSFDANGGSAVASQKIADNGSKATRPADPTRSGYSFAGWTLDAAGTKSYDFNTVVTGNVTLYAQWKALPPVKLVTSFSAAGSSSVAENSATVSATLKDSAGKPVAGAGVVFATSDGKVSASVKTDASGVAKANLTGLKASTKYSVGAKYAGDATHSASALGSPIVFTTKAAAKPKPVPSVTVSFDANGGKFANGSAVQKVSVKQGAKYALAAAPARSGYTFAGWFTAKSGGSKVTGSLVASGSLTLYAQWKAVPPAKLATAFSAAGSSNVTVNGASVSATLKDSAGKPVAGAGVVFATSDGKVSVSVKTDASGVAKANLTGLKASTKYSVGAKYAGDATHSASALGSPIVFTTKAVAKPKPVPSVTVSFDANGGKFANGSAVQKVSVKQGAKYTLAAAPSRSGYSFTGWYTAKSGGSKVTGSLVASGSLTVYAQWKAVPKPAPVYTVSFDANGGRFSNGSASQKVSVKQGAKYALATAPVRSGYSFSGWFTAKTGGSKVTGTPAATAARTLYAQWKALPAVKLVTSFSAAGSSNVTVNGATVSATLKDSAGKPIAGAAVTFATADGKTSASAKTNASGVAKANLTGLKAATKYSVGAKYAGDATHSASALGSPISFTTKAAAKPTPVYTVSFDANGGKFANGSAVQKVSVKQGAKYALAKAPSRSGYTFSGWFTDKSGGSKVTGSPVATGSRTLYARWAKNAPAPKPSLGAPVAVYRVYNRNSGLHHYTTNLGEKNALVKLGWKYEGVSFNAAKQGSAAGLVPVYREYNPHDGNHNWTLNQNEHRTLVKLGWNDEGVAWYANPSGPVTVYRLYNPYSGEHVYTTSAKEYAVVGAAGWHQEGTAWKGL